MPPNAKACPECGSDESTGWSERAQSQSASDRLGIPSDEEFDYDNFVKEEFGEKKPEKSGMKLFWTAVAVATLLALGVYFIRF